jgi:beta-galactosidase
MFKKSLLFCFIGALSMQAAEFSRVFSPSEGMLKPQEQPFREEVCLNGSWQFQPVALPQGFQRDAGQPPVLPQPKADGWDPTAIKIPSPWNVNTWGSGRKVGEGTEHPYWPDSVYFPSYPESWDGAEMGWLRRSFKVPDGWGDKRILLHFDSVAGDAAVFVNGKQVGTHFDKFLPFDIDVTDVVNREGENELLVGVRSMTLFNERSGKYNKMVAPYAPGSNTERLVGIWQDVFLLGVPAVRVDNVFVKPLVNSNTLEIEITVSNQTAESRTIDVGGEIAPWVNLAGNEVLDAPEPKWRLDSPILSVSPQSATVEPGKTATVTLSQKVDGKLNLWSPEVPQLYAALVSLGEGGMTVDTKYTRFGWREFTIAGKDLLLNGKKIQLFGDLLHPFGAYTSSRRFVWAWYKMIKDFGGNAVRPHAQIYPKAYLDLADEMGIVLLDETAIFGSSIALNFDNPEAWTRYQEHLDGLVLRDRNHPSVMGWSFGNELFAIFELNNVSNQDRDRWYRQLADLGLSVHKLDSTRPWISCDGDEDLRGTLPVWSKHFGHNTPLDRLPDIDKPLMVGESGGSYYARPKQMAEFNGDRAYESYEGRNEALGIDVYDNIVRMARPKLAYFSASETAWFGIEHLNFGYNDYSRLPGKNDGVTMTHPFAEGEPGVQVERIPPYVATLNPGWDESLPLYKPLAMFNAQKAALAQPAPLPGAWDHRVKSPASSFSTPEPTIKSVAFIGDEKAPLFRKLASLGVPFEKSATNAKLTIIDADSLTSSQAMQGRRVIDGLESFSGNVLVMLGAGKVGAAQLKTLFPEAVQLTDRAATALVPDDPDGIAAGLRLPDLYFAEEGNDRFIMKHGLAGPLVAKGRSVLSASNTDWSLFNNAPENAKCAAVVLYEHLEKPAGTAMVDVPVGKGHLILCSLDYQNPVRAAGKMWRALFANMGVALGEGSEMGTPAISDEGVLVNALSIGRFAAPSLDEALRKAFVNEKGNPVDGMQEGGLTWKKVNCPSKDRFIAQQLDQKGPKDKPFAIYFSFWIRSPRSLDDLLAGGPDAPRFRMITYAFEKSRVFLNGKELTALAKNPADYRTMSIYEDMHLKKDWNHVLIKVVSDRAEGPEPATLAVRVGSNNEEFMSQLETAVQPLR